MTGDTPISELRGVGPLIAVKFRSLKIANVRDLAAYLPRRYEDYSSLTSINALKPGKVTIKAKISSVSGKYVRRGMHITEAIAVDSTGSTRIVWFNQPYRPTSLKKDKYYYISGVYELSHQKFGVLNPSIELVSEFQVNTARIVPVYRETKGLTSRQIRGFVAQTLPYILSLRETLPLWVVSNHKLYSYPAAIKNMHFPESDKALKLAKRRLGFEEIFRLALASILNKHAAQSETALSIGFNKALAQNLVKNLHFKLTADQRRVAWEVYLDLEKPHPMNRLIEGDVGSGKTVVAAMAAAMALSHGYQVAMMAPTEILARQHAKTLAKILQPAGMHKNIELLVGSATNKQKSITKAAINEGKSKLIIGTQALIQENVDFRKLALIIIDEQHRFGVEQRKTLMRKAGHMPHVLSLTATPIPRTLALVLYGELDVSLIKNMPVGRKPIITKIVSPNSRESLYATIRRELSAGRQMFVVCPLIVETEDLDINSAEKIYQTMCDINFKDNRVALLHGRMKPSEKIRIMQEFSAGEIDILVSTTVIEVGVDVPNASIMLIESPERYGLAQIHQLRGRVGRGKDQGYCYLMMNKSNVPSRRLRALESNNDGFKLAELDMEIRGPGAIYGTLQHGQLDMRVANLSDAELIAESRAAAEEFIRRGENLLDYKQLNIAVNKFRAVTNLN